MKIIKSNDAMQGQNSNNCKTIEYSFRDKDIDLGIATIKGRYPDSGYCMNLKSKQLMYIIDGSGILFFENGKIEFSKGDSILIQPNEKYYYTSNHCVISMACTPAWSPEQYKIVE